MWDGSEQDARKPNRLERRDGTDEECSLACRFEEAGWIEGGTRGLKFEETASRTFASMIQNHWLYVGLNG